MLRPDRLRLPAIRIAAGVVLIAGGLLAIVGALALAGFLPVYRADDVMADEYYAAATGQHILTWMAFVVVDAAGVMALSGRPSAGRLRSIGLWLALAGGALLIAMIVISSWSAWSPMPRCAPFSHYDLSDSNPCHAQWAWEFAMLSVVQWASIVGMVALVSGWLLWLASWMADRLRGPR